MKITKPQPLTSCKRHNPAAGATQGYDRLHTKTLVAILKTDTVLRRQLSKNQTLCSNKKHIKKWVDNCASSRQSISG